MSSALYFLFSEFKMESPVPNTVTQAEPLQPLENLADDLTKPFACNHVVVNYKAEEGTLKDKGDVTSKKKKKKSKREIKTGGEVISFCVMCGEKVLEKGEKDGSGQDIVFSRESTLDEGGFKVHDSKRTVYRQNSSTISLSSSKLPNVDSRACLIHGHKKIKYFCEDHQEVCCSVCVNVLHRGCKRVMFIKDELKNGWDMRVCEETAKTLNEIVNSFEQIMAQNETSLEKLHEEVSDFRQRKDQLRDRVIEVLDQFDKSSEKQVKKFIKISESRINSTLDTCREVIKDLEACTELLEVALKSSSEKETFIATHKVLKQKNKYGLVLSEAIKHSKSISIDLIPETCIESIESINKVADVQFCAEEVRFPESVLASVSKLPQTDLRSPRNVLDAFTRSESTSSLESPLTFGGKYNVRLADDKNACENVDIEFLQEDRIAVVDMKNKKLKVFDSKFSKASAVELTSEPRGIAVISPQEVAVTLPDESKIQIVSTGKRLSTTRSILTSLPCYGITCYNQQLIVLCDDGFSTTAIQVLDFEGKILNNLKMNKSGKVILKNPWDIAATLDGQHVCVTDRGRLVCLDFNGNAIFQYSDELLENARGLAADDRGRFYICGTGSGNVHQVSADGKKLAVVLDEKDVASPQAVCYQPTKRNLLLTSVGDDHVYLFKLSKS